MTTLTAEDEAVSDLPVGWRLVRLGDVLRLQKNVVHPRNNPSGPATFVGLEHIESHTGRRIGAVELEMSRMTGRKPRFRKGEIVYGYLRPYLNKVWIAEFDGLCSVDQYVYEVNRDTADAEFVAWFMRSPTYLQRAPIDTTPGQLPRIRTEEVAAVKMELPPLEEQRRIAGRLREQLAEVAKARTAVQAQLAAAQALPAAALRAVFQSPVADAWPTELLGDVTRIGAGVTLGRDLRGRETRLVPYLRVANVKDSWLDLSDVKEVEATEREIEDCQLRYGDLLLTEGGDRDKLGRGMYWQDQLPECIHQNHIFRVRFDLTKFDPAFVSLQVSSEYGKAFFLAHAKQTTGIATINRGVLTRFPLRTPPLADQRAIAARLAAELAEVTRLRESLSGKLETLDRLPAALLAQAFQGGR